MTFSRHCKGFLCATAMVLALAHGPMASPAMAQDAVQARVAAHDDYSRLVFDWPAAVPYTINRNGDRVEIRFTRAGQLTPPATLQDGIIAVEQIAGGTQPLVVALTLAAGREMRHFAIGSRVIFDVVRPAGAPQPPPARAQAPTTQTSAAQTPAAQTAATQAPAAQTPPAQTPSAPPAAAAPVTTPPPASAAQTAPAMPAKAVEAVSNEELPAVKSGVITQPHTISITSTEAIGVAAFRRFNDLWVVVDRPNFNVTPHLSGPQRDKFTGFAKVSLPQATAFRMPLPEGMDAHIFGEGGGLVWRVVLTPSARYDAPVLPQRDFTGNDPARGGTITWPMRRVTKIVELPDTHVGDTIIVGTVTDAAQYSGVARDFVDFSSLQAPIGIALLSAADDLRVELVNGAVRVSRPDGLAISRVRDVRGQQLREQLQDLSTPPDSTAADGMRRIFDFDRWVMGGPLALRENQNILLSSMAHKDKNGRVQDLLSLAKMNIANDRGQEALGFLNFALAEIPQLKESPEFLALRGAAEALSGKYELAWQDLGDPMLLAYDELDYWRAYTLAWLEDWQQAGKTLPDKQDVLLSYPRPLLEKMGIKLAEVALRKDNVPRAEVLLAALARERNALMPWTQAGLDYMTGQALRQKGLAEQTFELWTPLVKGKDDFYRARAGLALTMLELERDEIILAQAIDRLEGLRYAWRGDELEAQINFTLGQLYIQNDEYMKGFTILREAAELRPDADINREINDYMVRSFVDLISNDAELSPADAVMVFEEFKALTPDTEAGRNMVRRLAERLVDADLLTRAAALLQNQVDFRAGGAEQARTAMRLGAIYLLDNDPKPALVALDKAKTYYAAQTDAASQKQMRNADLMRARALSQMNMTEDAIALLNGYPPDADINRLRADIAWSAGLWEDSAKALQDMIIDANIDETRRDLTLADADLILNRAVALNLSGNRVALANMQKRYGPAMQKTARSRLFDVVTRPRKTSIIADRDTIEQIVSEVDIFKGFLDAYKQTQDLGSN